MRAAVRTPNGPVGISGIGHYVPARRLDNRDIAALGSPVAPEWIAQKTGIHARHVADDSEAMSDLVIQAARTAMTMAGAASVDAILVAGDNLDFGGVRLTSGVVATALGLDATTIYDVRVGCPGSVLGLHFGTALVASGLANRVLVAAAEVNTRGSAWSARSSVWFGDGAGAVVLERCAPQTGILATMAAGTGKGADILQIPAGGSREPLTPDRIAAGRGHLYMDARAVFGFAVLKFTDTLTALTAHAGLALADLDIVVPHQANLRIIEAATTVLGIDPRRVLTNLDRVGNTGAPSVLIALSEAVANGRVRPGDVVATVGFGGGLAWGGQIIRWNTRSDVLARSQVTA